MGVCRIYCPTAPHFIQFSKLAGNFTESKFLRRNILQISFFTVARKVERGCSPSGRASLRASPFIRKYQRLVLDYGVYQSPFCTTVQPSPRTTSPAPEVDSAGLYFIEGTAVDGDVSGGASCSSASTGGGALEGTAVNDDLCVVVGVDQVILIGIAGDLLGKFAAVDDNGTIIPQPIPPLRSARSPQRTRWWRRWWYRP